MIAPTLTRAAEALHPDPVTGPLGLLRGRTTLVVADVENLERAAARFGLHPHWEALARALRHVAPTLALHAFLAIETAEDPRRLRLARSGWTAHAKPVRRVASHRGVRFTRNVDVNLAAMTGYLAGSLRPRAVVLATGDGALADDVAETLLESTPPEVLVTLSVAGATASRLEARTSPFFDENLELGLDCLAPLPGPRNVGEHGRIRRTARLARRVA